MSLWSYVLRPFGAAVAQRFELSEKRNASSSVVRFSTPTRLPLLYRRPHSLLFSVSLSSLCFVPHRVRWQVLSLQTNLAVQVARAVGSPGSAVLIFVPGMATILEIMNLFELISSADVTYKVWKTARGK